MTSESPSKGPGDGVVASQDGAVLVITINRPEVRNALSWRHRDRIVELLELASVRPDIRAIVLTGGDEAFCAGGDLRSPMPVPDRPAGSGRAVGDVSRSVRNAQRLVAAVLDCPRPIVAAVGGVAAGLGAQLALACDVVVATRTARFAEVFVRNGILPDAGAAYLLPRLVGPHLAKRLLLFGGEIDASRAAELGLVTEVVDGSPFERSMALARELASGPTIALGLTKQLVNRSLDQSRDDAFAAEVLAQEMNVATVDAAEGLAAFAERRSPRFEGR